MPLRAEAAELCVNLGGTSGCYSSIKAAVAAAQTGDVIAVDAGVYFEQDITITKSVDLVGVGTDATIIDGSTATGNGPQVFSFVSPGTLLSVRFWNLTIRHGSPAIVASGAHTVTLEHVHLTQNGPRGGLYMDGTYVLVSASLIDYNSADASFTVCGFSGSGGGIGVHCGGGKLDIRNSTISNNTAAVYGGGIFIDKGDVRIVNSTLSGNTTGTQGAGIYATQAAGSTTFTKMGIVNTTITGNAGGDSLVLVGGTSSGPATPLYLQGNIIDHSTAGKSCFFNPAFAMSSDFNVAADNSCSLTGPSDIVADPQLGPLQTKESHLPTHVIAPASPAKDRIPPGSCWTSIDQRGMPRPQGAGCDSGSFEIAN
jgi:hypothetical protein